VSRAAARLALLIAAHIHRLIRFRQSRNATIKLILCWPTWETRL
jgi:hypothetical protein